MKVGTHDSKLALKEMAAAYRRLSAAELSKLKDDAFQVNELRRDFLKQPIQSDVNTEANASELTRSQIHRLSQARLDVSLQSVTSNAIWQNGLGLSDHV